MTRDAPVPLSHACIPSLADVTRDAYHAPRRKAVAENWMAGDIVRAAPLHVARVRHPLAVKAAMAMRPPLQWTGGALVELLKKMGVTLTCDSFRDVMIVQDAARQHGRLLRRQLATAAVFALQIIGGGCVRLRPSPCLRCQ